MTIFWSASAQADLGRVHEFLARHDVEAANALLMTLVRAPEALLDFPRRGPRLNEFAPREVREFRVSRYLIRYELILADVMILRIFHAKEDRF